MNRRLLIISNNVLSYTNNNGKTLLSFVDGATELDVYQLYLSGELPRVQDYHYFQISDKDIIKGYFKEVFRGKEIEPEIAETRTDDFSLRRKFGKNSFTLFLRDAIWHNRWNSVQLEAWLDRIKPDAVLFVMGDSLFPYSICEYVYKKYAPRLLTFFTDDYILPRTKESFLHRQRRVAIKKKAQDIISKAAVFYTISEPMRRDYRKIFGKDSRVIMNMTDDILVPLCKKEEKEIILTYAGSLYYKRDSVLEQLAHAVNNYNQRKGVKPAKLKIYSNEDPSEEQLKRICVEGACEYGGSLNKEQLIKRLNSSDILVFVESFDEAEKEKTRLSLSTKVPEYLSIGKPVLAIGPNDIGSMEYLQDAAACVNDLTALQEILDKVLLDKDYAETIGNEARKKFITNHNKEKLQNEFINDVLGYGEGQ